MADSINERLKQEGQLVRNSGTNSIKSVKQTLNINHEKLTSVYGAISDSLNIQTEILGSMLNLQQKSFNIQSESIRDEARRERLMSLKSKRQTQAVASVGKKSGMPFSGERGFGFGFLLLGSLFSGALLQGGVALIASRVSGLLLKGGFIGLVAPFIGDFVSDIMEKTFESLGADDFISDENQSIITNAIKNSITFGAFGMLLGKRFGLMFAAGGLIYGGIKSVIEDSDNEILKKMKEQFGTENLAALASVVAYAFGFGTVKYALRGALFKNTGGAGEPKSRFKKNLLRSLKPGMITLFGTVGILAGQAISEASGSEKLGNSISTVASFAAAGSLFGPKGALLGAIAGIAFTGASWLYEWFTKQNSAIDERLRRRVKDLSVDEVAEAIDLETPGVVGAGSTGAATGQVIDEKLGDLTAGLATQVLAKRAAEEYGKDPNNIQRYQSALMERADQVFDFFDENKDDLSENDLRNLNRYISDLKTSIEQLESIEGYDDRSGIVNNLRDVVDRVEEEVNLDRFNTGPSIKPGPVDLDFGEAQKEYYRLMAEAEKLFFDGQGNIRDMNERESNRYNDLIQRQNEILEEFGSSLMRGKISSNYIDSSSQVRGGDTYNTNNNTTIVSRPDKVLDPAGP